MTTVHGHKVYTEDSLKEKGAKRFLLRITAGHGSRGVNASVHLLESKSQQVHRGIRPLLMATSKWLQFMRPTELYI